MIPKTGPISIDDFKKSYGCHVSGGNPEFGGTSSPNAPFELSSQYTKEMIPNWHPEYVGDQQDVEDMRGCVASLNRENWSTRVDYQYPGRTFVYYGNPTGMTTIRYSLVTDGSSGSNFSDPWGTNIQHRLQGKANSSDSKGLNSAVLHNFHFYMDTAETIRLKFRARFTFSGSGPSRDPTPPASGERQCQSVVAVEYGDTWNGSNSNVVYNNRFVTAPNASAQDRVFSISFNASRPYKLISLQTNNHGHPTTLSNDQFRGYFGNFYFSLKDKP